jgi:hypothetical protein
MTTGTSTGGTSTPDAGCFLTDVGVFGQCVQTPNCSPTDQESTPGLCGDGGLVCCTAPPNVADNPQPPAGWVVLPQAEVTQAISDWAVAIVNDPVTYPMYSEVQQTFGTLKVLAIVVWLPPDIQNSFVHRGVALYQPAVDGG